MHTQTVLNSSTPATSVLDAEGRATAIGEQIGGGTAYTSTFAFNLNDLPLTVTLPPGSVQETALYDAQNRLVHVGASGPSKHIANPLNSSYDYAYNAVGWTTAQTATVNTINGGNPVTQTLGHDAFGRLTGLQSAASSQSWTFDGNGNLLTLTTPGQPTAYYGYDPNGNTTGITSTGSLSTGLSYDSQARFVGVTLQDGTMITTTYNTAGRLRGEQAGADADHPLPGCRVGADGQMMVVTGRTRRLEAQARVSYPASAVD